MLFPVRRRMMRVGWVDDDDGAQPGQVPFTVGPAGCLEQRVGWGDHPVHDREIDVDARLDQLRCDEEHRFASVEPPTYLIKDTAAVRRAHPGRQAPAASPKS